MVVVPTSYIKVPTIYDHIITDVCNLHHCRIAYKANILLLLLSCYSILQLKICLQDNFDITTEQSLGIWNSPMEYMDFQKCVITV